MAEHSIYAPSSMHRLLACPASFRESQQAAREKSSMYARKGTLKHELFTQIWPDYVAQNAARMNVVFKHGEESAKRDGEFEYTMEDHQDVLACCDYVKTILVTCGPNATVELEKRVTLASFGLPDVWGTGDVIIDDPDNQRLICADHKFGAGVPVYAEENPQGLTYTAGAAGFPLVYDHYEFHVIQPPINNFSSYTINKAGLEGFVNKISLGIEACKSPDAPYNPSEHSCKFCPARTTCRARHDLALRQAQDVFKIATKMPDVTNEEKAELAGLLKNLEQVKKSLYADIQATIMNGESVPGWKLVAGRSIRKWGDEAVALKWLMSSKMLEEDDLFEEKFLSPSKAEKLNRKFKKDEGFLGLIIKPVGKPQLVDESDRRPDYDVNATADAVFSKQ